MIMNSGPNSWSQALALLVLVLFPLGRDAVAAEPAPEPEQIFRGMVQAAKHLNYDGTFIYRRNQFFATVRIIHQGGSMEQRLLSLNGVPREAFRDSRGRAGLLTPHGMHVTQSSSRWLHRVLHGPGVIADLDRVKQYYRFRLAGETRIADKNSWIVDLLPNDDLRYGYRFCIDKQHALLLRSELKNHIGGTIEEFIFTKLKIADTIPDELLQPQLSTEPVSDGHVSASTEQPMPADHSPWAFTRLPPGFIPNEHGARVIDISGASTRQMVLSDGLAVVSVFAERNDPKLKLPRGRATIAGVRLARHRQWFDCAKAVDQLGLPQSSLDDAFASAVDWFAHQRSSDS